jgi:nucleoside-diphosphate-sugar epimerase
MKVVVTGAGGFVGQEICAALLAAGHVVHALARRPFAATTAGGAALKLTLIEDLAASARADEWFAGAEAVIHLAARVHRVSERPGDAEPLYARDVEIARQLALAAHRAGARRLVFMSSIKALADSSAAGVALARSTIPRPVDPYGRAKLAAERELEAVSTSTGLEVAVIRAPLVYGARAGANFRQMVRWVRRGMPLPLAGVQNRRSIVSADSLAQSVLRCLGPLSGSYNVYHVSDPAPVSTPELLGYVARGLNIAPRLFAAPTPWLEFACKLVGRADLAVRLLRSLEFEVEDSFAALGWRPGTSTRDGVTRAVRAMRL